MELIDGKKLADEVLLALQDKIAQENVKPHLIIVLVGDNEASQIYVRNKLKAAEKVGIVADVVCLPADVSQQVLGDKIVELNHDNAVHGIVVQQPLPEGLSIDEVVEKIAPEKDVDGFGISNIGKLVQNLGDGIIAATPKAVLNMLVSTGVALAGKHAVIIGRSKIVGRPLAALLLNHDCTVTVAHTKTRNLADLVRTADIVVAACGQPKLVKKDWLKKGAVVIDVGINRVGGRLCGDVDFENAAEVCSFISPVPGGVGPMTVAMLLENTFEAFNLQRRKG